ncbi:MAG TPA: hypothetical protein VGU67_13350 [Edaphobacter sp.]|nr:hypothetical protein [Edaphobacter sp.]
MAVLHNSNPVLKDLGEGRWGLEQASRLARGIEGNRREVRALVGALFGTDAELRKRASDVARRMTEFNSKPLEPYADELAGLLAVVPVEESRTRWHLGLVVARIAHTREQRLRAARLMALLAEDTSNVTRCSAIEGMGVLAAGEASLRDDAEELIERALWDGTPAMKCRAREAKRRLEKAGTGLVEF